MSARAPSSEPDSAEVRHLRSSILAHITTSVPWALPCCIYVSLDLIDYDRTRAGREVGAWDIAASIALYVLLGPLPLLSGLLGVVRRVWSHRQLTVVSWLTILSTVAYTGWVIHALSTDRIAGNSGVESAVNGYIMYFMVALNIARVLSIVWLLVMLSNPRVRSAYGRPTPPKQF
jgi:hypothetical protein